MLQTFSLVATQVFSTVLASMHQVALMVSVLVFNSAVEVIISPFRFQSVAILKFFSSITLILTLVLSIFSITDSRLVSLAEKVGGCAGAALYTVFDE